MKQTAVDVTGIGLLLGSAVFTLGSTSHAGTSTSTKCGVERWKVKTLQDRPKLRATDQGSGTTATIRPLGETSISWLNGAVEVPCVEKRIVLPSGVCRTSSIE